MTSISNHNRAGGHPTPLSFTPFVVIPAYQEGRSIAEVVTECREYNLTVIVIDDGSTDATAIKARCAGALVIQLPINRGKGAALKHGIARAIAEGATHVATIDADGQHLTKDLLRLIDLARKQPEALIIGSRRAGRRAAPMGRRVANAIADFWIGLAVGISLDDSQSGLRIYPTALLPILLRITEPGFAWETAALILAGEYNVQLLSIPVSAIYACGGRLSHFRPAADITQITTLVGGYLLKNKRLLGKLRHLLQR